MTRWLMNEVLQREIKTHYDCLETPSVCSRAADGCSMMDDPPAMLPCKDVSPSNLTKTKGPLEFVSEKMEMSWALLSVAAGF